MAVYGMARKALNFHQWVSAVGYARVKWALAYLDRKGGIPMEWRGKEAEIIISMLDGELMFRYEGEAFSRLKSAWGAHKSRLAQKKSQGGFEQVTIRGRLGLQARFKELLKAIDVPPEDALELLIADIQEFKKRLKADEHKTLTQEIRRLKGQESQRPKRVKASIIGHHLAEELKIQERAADMRLKALCSYFVRYGVLMPLTKHELARAEELYRQKKMEFGDGMNEANQCWPLMEIS